MGLITGVSSYIPILTHAYCGKCPQCLAWNTFRKIYLRPDVPLEDRGVGEKLFRQIPEELRVEKEPS